MGRTSPLVLAFVGMPGAGKTEATQYVTLKGIPFVRFGDITDEGIKNLGLPLTPDNEKNFREKLRQELGMAAYAIKSKPKIEALLKTHDVIAIDGLYSWEEYIFLKEAFPGLTLIHVFAEPEKRYARLSKRAVRPLSKEEAIKRDIAEIEKLNKAGPISMADYLIDNTEDNVVLLHQKIDHLLNRILK